MKIGILGPGAIGCLVGSLLYKAGNEVFFIGKDTTANFINQKGINIKSKFYGEFTIYPNASSNSLEIFDVIFISVKAFELQNALKLIFQNTGKHTIIISLLNGTGHKEIISVLNVKNIFIGTIGAVEVSLDENRNVIHSSLGETHIEMASDLDCSESTILPITNLLIQAGFSVSIYKSENEVIWRKLVRLAAISTMTSIARAPLGIVRNNSELNLLMEKIVLELCIIAETQHLIINPEVVMSQIRTLPESLTTSMQRDIVTGKQSEIEAILGKTIQLGQAEGLSLPYLQKCYSNLVKSFKF